PRNVVGLTVVPDHAAWSSPPLRSRVTVAEAAFDTVQVICVLETRTHGGGTVASTIAVASVKVTSLLPLPPRVTVTLLASLPLESLYVTSLPLAAIVAVLAWATPGTN